jgi:PiT family inorganic phosphate transporter
MFELVLLTIGVALVFDFYNGMNDAANSIATIVSTRILTPRQAVSVGRLLEL